MENWNVQLQVIKVSRGGRTMADNMTMEKLPSTRSASEVAKEVESQGDAGGDLLTNIFSWTLVWHDNPLDNERISLQF